jgi:hypothetical protein
MWSGFAGPFPVTGPSQVRMRGQLTAPLPVTGMPRIPTPGQLITPLPVTRRRPLTRTLAITMRGEFPAPLPVTGAAPVIAASWVTGRGRVTMPQGVTGRGQVVVPRQLTGPAGIARPVWAGAVALVPPTGPLGGRRGWPATSAVRARIPPTAGLGGTRPARAGLARSLPARPRWAAGLRRGYRATGGHRATGGGTRTRLGLGLPPAVTHVTPGPAAGHGRDTGGTRGVSGGPAGVLTRLRRCGPASVAAEDLLPVKQDPGRQHHRGEGAHPDRDIDQLKAARDAPRDKSHDCCRDHHGAGPDHE